MPFLIVSMCAALLSIKRSVSHSLHLTDLMMMKGKFDIYAAIFSRVPSTNYDAAQYKYM